MLRSGNAYGRHSTLGVGLDEKSRAIIPTHQNAIGDKHDARCGYPVPVDVQILCKVYADTFSLKDVADVHVVRG